MAKFKINRFWAVVATLLIVYALVRWGIPAISREAARWWKTQWTGPSFMAVGLRDPVLGPPVMKALRETIRACPAPLEIPEGGHFVQEHGEQIARAALASFV